MPLNEEQIRILRTSIEQYDYPKFTFDFSSNREIEHPTMRSVEQTIRDYLMSVDQENVKDGFANVLYWGHYSSGVFWNRVNKFREKVIQEKINDAIEVIHNLHGTGLKEIKELKLPEFSYMSFISKVRMFLDPDNFVILDRKLMNISRTQVNTIFRNIKQQKTYIPITEENEHYYQEWCDICKYAVRTYFPGQNLLAVDIERGVFRLVDTGRVEEAAMIVASIY